MVESWVTNIVKRLNVTRVLVYRERKTTNQKGTNKWGRQILSNIKASILGEDICEWHVQ